MLRYALVATCMVLAAAGAVRAADIMVGASGTSTRIIFHVKAGETFSPDLEQQNQTLIVNFPHTVAGPQNIHDRFLIQSLSFDGTRAVIAMKRPFTYTSSLKNAPTRLVVDITEVHGEQQGSACPVRRFEVHPGTDLLSVAMILKDGFSADVRASGGGRIFIHFPSEISCTDMDALLKGIPQLSFVGLMKMSSGTTLTLALDKQYALKRTGTDHNGTRITFEMSPPGTPSPESRESIARGFSDAGNSPGVVHVLEPHVKTLSPGEKILLAQAYWSQAFPYRMGAKADRALSLMHDATRDVSDGPGQERALLDYCSMLIHAGRPGDASAPITGLKTSEDSNTRIEASIREMDVLNRSGSYDDAYAAGRRLIMGLGGKELPGRLRPLYSTVLADTYLGLNDHPKALEFYRQAIAADPDYPRRDPDIYARMGDAAFRMNDFSHAREYLCLAINLSGAPERQKYLLMLGDSLYQTGEKDSAIVVFSQVEALAPQGDGLSIARLKTARIIIEKNTDERGRLSDRAFHEVMDIYETLKASEEIKDKSLSSLVKVRIAQAYARHGDWEQALETYYEVWKSTKKGDSVHHYAQVEAIRSIIERSRILYRDSRHDKILDIYSRYRDSFVKELQDSATLFIIGDALNRLGQIEQARTMLELSTRGDSIYKEQAFYLLFTIDLKREKFQEALLWNTIYLSTYPSGNDAQVMKDRRGEVLYRLDSITAALPLLETTAGGGGPYALHALSYLADAYRRLDMPKQEQQTLDRIIALHPDRVSPAIEKALYRRADQVRKNGELDRASSLYEALLGAYPRSPQAHWAMLHLAEISHVRGNDARAADLLAAIMKASTDPVLVSAARATSDMMALNRDLEGYEAGKPGAGR